ncbi:MAG: IS66 family transposase [bacterium]
MALIRRRDSERPSYDDLVRENTRLRTDNASLRSRIRELEHKVEELARAAKRQSAPFSKNKPTPSPKPSGRKAGKDYGQRAARAVPGRIDRVIDAPLPEVCPDCEGELVAERVAVQYQVEIPKPTPVHTRFDVAVGRCMNCGRRVQGRHAEQTSDALGAASVQIGAHAQALASFINKGLGVPHEKTAAILGAATGVDISPATVVRATHRAAAVLEPSYDAIADAVAAAEVVSPDETGWRVGGVRHWLWVAVCSVATLYQVTKGRGFAEVCALLGEDYTGVLCRDGWAPYRCLKDARHQTCYAHLLRRCAEMIESSRTRAQVIPRALAGILIDALALRDSRDAAEITRRQLVRRTKALERRVDTLLAITTSNPANARLLGHVRTERDNMFTFLRMEDVHATNYKAEQGIRPAVVTRKNWGGNATDDGAHTFEVLLSVFRTAHQQGANAIGILVERLRDPEWRVAPQLALTTETASPR